MNDPIEILTQAEYDAREARKIEIVSNWLSSVLVFVILLWAIFQYW